MVKLIPFIIALTVILLFGDVIKLFRPGKGNWVIVVFLFMFNHIGKRVRRLMLLKVRGRKRVTVLGLTR